MVRKLPEMLGHSVSIPGWRRSPGEGNSDPPVFLPRNSHEQRSLVGYSSWDPKESDTTEQIYFFFFFFSLSLFSIIREHPPKNSLLHLSPAIERGTL